MIATFVSRVVRSEMPRLQYQPILVSCMDLTVKIVKMVRKHPVNLTNQYFVFVRLILLIRSVRLPRDGREQTIGSIEMLLTLGFIFTFIAKSSQLEMNSRLYGRVGAKGLNLLCQQRNVRIMNSFKRAPVSSTPPKSSTSLSALEDANGETITNPKMAFVNAILASFKRKDAQKLFICENKHIAHDGSTAKGIKSVTGRLVEIKAGLRLQLVYRCLTTDITKNLELHEVENAINDILAEGFKRATFSSSIETHELSLRRGSGNLKVTAAENLEEAEEEVNLQHDRKKNVPIDSQAQFLKVIINSLHMSIPTLSLVHFVIR